MKLNNKGYTIKALLNTEANEKLFINKETTESLIKQLNVKTKRFKLKKVKGFCE